MPDVEIVARQIALVKQLHPDWKIAQIAHYIYLPQLIIINALYKGVEMELFEWVREKDQIKLASTDWYAGGSLGNDIDYLADTILSLITHNNAREQDIALDQLAHWATGINPMGQELAVFKLGTTKKITSYKIADKDDQASVYEFITLPANLDKRWGSKQFKKGKKKIAKKK